MTDANLNTPMREGFEQQRKAGMNVDWFTWQIAWHDALFTQCDIPPSASIADTATVPTDLLPQALWTRRGSGTDEWWSFKGYQARKDAADQWVLRKGGKELYRHTYLQVVMAHAEREILASAESIADTAGAKPKYWLVLGKVFNTEVSAKLYAAKSGGMVEPVCAAPPAPSVADEPTVQSCVCIAKYCACKPGKCAVGMIDGRAPSVAEKVFPDDTKVICPACTHQFRAIPLDVQRELASAPSVADAAGASDVHIATVYEDNDGTKHVQLDVENFDDLPVGMKLYARYENGL